jgi:hypothetical protein
MRITYLSFFWELRWKGENSDGLIYLGWIFHAEEKRLKLYSMVKSHVRARGYT